jgi:hypothetical protein
MTNEMKTEETALSGMSYDLEMTQIDFTRTRNKHKPTEEELIKQ